MDTFISTKLATTRFYKRFATNTCSWREQGGIGDGAQVGLLIDRSDRTINICDEKQYSITKAYTDALRMKMAIFAEATRPQDSCPDDGDHLWHPPGHPLRYCPKRSHHGRPLRACVIVQDFARKCCRPSLQG